MSREKCTPHKIFSPFLKITCGSGTCVIVRAAVRSCDAILDSGPNSAESFIAGAIRASRQSRLASRCCCACHSNLRCSVFNCCRSADQQSNCHVNADIDNSKSPWHSRLIFREPAGHKE